MTAGITVCILSLTFTTSIVHCINNFAPVSLHGSNEVDLIRGLNLHNTSYVGLLNLNQIIYLSGNSRRVQLPSNLFEKASQLVSHTNEFTIMATVKQNLRNTGAIVSFSKGNDRYLELQSSGRRNEIRLIYRDTRSDGDARTLVFNYRLADDNWHQLALSVSGTLVDLYLDCSRIARKTIGDISLKGLESTSLWLGQRNNHFMFKGYLRDVKLIAGESGYNVQCPHLAETDCPTCGQFKKLQSLYAAMENRVNEISEKLINAERKLAQLEQLDVMKICYVNKTIRGDGETWNQDCDNCSCARGKVSCQTAPCPPLPCKNPEYIPGKCCPVCKGTCVHNGRIFQNGDKYTKACVTCECINGTMKCIQRQPACPPLNCPPSQQFRKNGDCCKYCRDFNFCGLGHDCHTNASCHNLKTSYTCHCNAGYAGNGRQCEDQDECLQEGGPTGHFCRENARCVNLPGSYACECLPGYKQSDPHTCIDKDECQLNDHRCHANAECVNTIGSYRCKCKDGYVGDGIRCDPVCRQPCQNGGKCVAPETCLCLNGFTGEFCQNDIDECQLDMNLCPENSVCINKKGWSECQCKEGYENVLDSYNGIDCKDIDECADESHTCHETAVCVNMDGGYRCDCKPNVNCSYSCYDKGVERLNGETWPDEVNLCKKCTCTKGVTTCHAEACNCDDPKVDLDCCPQCDSNSQCHHQDDASVILKNGDKWTYKCQKCECLYGEIDCWDYDDCPPIRCSNPTRREGDCCPRCEDDPCDLPLASVQSNNTLTYGNISNAGCMYLGRLYQTGERVPIERDPCASCECKVPVCENSVSYNQAFNPNRMDSFAAFTFQAALVGRWLRHLLSS